MDTKSLWSDETRREVSEKMSSGISAALAKLTPEERSARAYKVAASRAANRDPYKFISPRGKLHLVRTSLKDFCTKHNLDRGNMSGVSSGRIEIHRGWTKG